MQGPVRVAVVGCGYMGRNHLRVYDNLKDTQLVGFLEIDDEAAETVLAQHDCRRFRTLGELAGEVDAVSICSPSVTHEEIGLHFLERGIHCLIEKPLATSEAACRALIDAAEDSGAVLLVGHIERFNPAVQQVLALLDKGAQVHAIDARRLSSVSKRIDDVDVVADLMVHDLDIVCALIKDRVASVRAAGVCTPGLSGRDHVTGLLCFEGGATATVTASRITQYTVRELSVVTDRGVIAVNYMDQSVDIYQHDTLRQSDDLAVRFGNYAIDIAMERIQVRRAEPLLIELAHFIDCIRNGTSPQVTGRQAMQALKLVWQIQRRVARDGLESDDRGSEVA